MERTELGKRILRYRAKHRLTQKQMAEVLGVGKHVVFNCENAVHKPHAANQIMLEEKMDELEEE